MESHLRDLHAGSSITVHLLWLSCPYFLSHTLPAGEHMPTFLTRETTHRPVINICVKYMLYCSLKPDRRQWGTSDSSRSAWYPHKCVRVVKHVDSLNHCK